MSPWDLPVPRGAVTNSVGDQKTCGKHDIRVHTHLLETKVQAMMGHRLYGKTIVEHMEDLEILFPGLTVAHTIWVTDRDINLAGKIWSRVVHNPASNLKLGMEYALLKDDENRCQCGFGN
jgi:cytosine/adenosine deaminase-related metal-dependent hydrolase